MKRKLLIIALCITCIVCVSSLTANGETDSAKTGREKTSSVSARQFESGEWVPLYMGSAVPERCVCVKNILRTQCMVGDISTNLSLCE